MSDHGTPLPGTGCRPSDQSAARTGGTAASIPRAAKRKTVDDIAREYLAAYRRAAQMPPPFRLLYSASGWFEFWYGDRRSTRVRSKTLREMTDRINARTAQETEARRVETLGSTCEGSVGSADAPDQSTHRTQDQNRGGEDV